MPTTFDVAQIADDEAITVKLRDGRELHAKDLLPEVVDNLGKVVDAHAAASAQTEVEQRRLIRMLQSDDTPDEEYGTASARLVALTTEVQSRDRTVAYEQIAAVFEGPDGKPLTAKALQSQIPLQVARKIAEEMRRQIFGDDDIPGNGQDDIPGNAEGSDTDPTPTGITS